jgi:DNA-binding NtrC family response regulator
MATLLIVDDEREICEMLARHYRFAGHDAYTAADGRAALAFMEDHKVDVVVSDIRMPGMDGIDLLREIRRLYPMTHTIMITGHVSQENLLSCMRHGADNCVFKPLDDLGELDESVDGALGALQRWKQKLRALRAMA